MILSLLWAMLRLFAAKVPIPQPFADRLPCRAGRGLDYQPDSVADEKNDKPKRDLILRHCENHDDLLVTGES
jgi:hypothetical protein